MAIYGASPKEQPVEGDVQKAGERAGAFKGRVAAILPARDGRDGYIQFGRESVYFPELAPRNRFSNTFAARWVVGHDHSSFGCVELAATELGIGQALEI
jgi:hypothetical protein